MLILHPHPQKMTHVLKTPSSRLSPSCRGLPSPSLESAVTETSLAAFRSTYQRGLWVSECSRTLTYLLLITHRKQYVPNTQQVYWMSSRWRFAKRSVGTGRTLHTTSQRRWSLGETSRSKLKPSWRWGIKTTVLLLPLGKRWDIFECGKLWRPIWIVEVQRYRYCQSYLRQLCGSACTNWWWWWTGKTSWLTRGKWITSNHEQWASFPSK